MIYYKNYFSLNFNLFLIDHRIINEGMTIIAVIIKNKPQSPFSQSTRAPEDEASVVLPAVPIDASKFFGIIGIIIFGILFIKSEGNKKQVR